MLVVFGRDDHAVRAGPDRQRDAKIEALRSTPIEGDFPAILPHRHVVDRAVRRTERTHILSTPDHSWIYERLGASVEVANGQAWQFKLSYLEPLQLLAYPEDGWFDWHSDLGDRGVASLRKVSASILLSDPDTYEGGELQLMNAGKELVPGRSQGRAILFPSFQNHRVLPVRRGTRHVLILWTVGRHPLR